MSGQINVKYIYQGEDKVISFELLNPNNTPVNLNNLHNVALWLIDSSGAILEKYAMNVVVGFNIADFDIISAVLGTFKINIRRSVTAKACTGALSFEINVAETSADFTDNKKYNIAQENIFYVKQSKGGGASI